MTKSTEIPETACKSSVKCTFIDRGVNIEEVERAISEEIIKSSPINKNHLQVQNEVIVVDHQVEAKAATNQDEVKELDDSQTTEINNDIIQDHASKDDSKENSLVEIENDTEEATSEQYESEKDHESDSDKEIFDDDLNTESRVLEDE